MDKEYKFCQEVQYSFYTFLSIHLGRGSFGQILGKKFRIRCQVQVGRYKDRALEDKMYMSSEKDLHNLHSSSGNCHR